MNNVLENAEASIVKWCVEQIPLLTSLSTTLTYVELDSRVELRDAELPTGDIIGLTQFSIMDDDKIFPIHFAIGVSTEDDENLFRLRALSNALYNKLQTGASLTYYDAQTAATKSWIQILPGTTILPTSRVETRPFRFIQVQALLDPYQSNG